MPDSTQPSPEHTVGGCRRVTLIPYPYVDRFFGPQRYLMLVVVLVALVLELTAGLPYTIIVGLACLPYFAVWAGLSHRARRAAKDITRRDGDPDLVCYGGPRDLAPLEDLPEHAFEPVVVQISQAAVGFFRRGWAVAFMTFLYVPACVLILAKFRPVMVVAGGITLLWLFQSGIVYAMPTYLRVVPGRLDVLRYRMFSQRIYDRRAIALTDASITCHYGRGTLTIATPGRLDAPFVLRLRAIPHVREFVAAVFRGATCRHRAAELPDDQLLG